MCKAPVYIYYYIHEETPGISAYSLYF